ncbi:DUF4349 domain-containing protein [Enterococcus sp. BWT-B8]|uniref:DUF4349 domain-containing protein n=1 Tax=Enterococcus sp. BWT-B8 TaxID=2885157 RepID=UPI001E3B730D|nr:DUF4349 domain-containing protein [Enterococcus sp. BWT-B8]MCB5952734.1 DUF4349 domain-containing protein [Enterococcus sp. BWT-B8]
MKLNQEWKQQWENIEVPQEKIDRMIEYNVREQTKPQSFFVSTKSVGRKIFSRFSRKTWLITTIGLAVLFIIVVAVNQAQTSKTNYMSSGTASDAGYTQDAALEKEEATAQKSESQTAEPSEKTAQFYVYSKQSTDFDKDIEALESLVKESNSYIESSNKGQWVGGLQQAYYVIRIPKSGSQDVLDKLSKIGETIDESVRTENYAATYLDNESRIEALEAEETALLELLKKSEKMDDMLKIQERLSVVRSERESLVRSNKGIDNKVDYLTVEVTIDEVDKTKKKQESPSLTQRIQGNFEKQKQYWQELGGNILVFIASNILYIVLVIVVILFLGYKYKKRKQKKTAVE